MLETDMVPEEESIQFFMACFVFQFFCFHIVQSGHTLCFYTLQKLGSSIHYLPLLNETYTLLVSIFYSAAGISVSHNSQPYFSQRWHLCKLCTSKAVAVFVTLPLHPSKVHRKDLIYTLCLHIVLISSLLFHSLFLCFYPCSLIHNLQPCG